jgi:hypothetical protein
MSELRSLHALTDRLATGRFVATGVDARLRVTLGASAASGAAAVTATALAGCGAASAEIGVASSSRIVTIPVLRPIVAPDGFESTTLNCSVASAALLFTIVTMKLICDTPGANVIVAVRVW